MPDIAGTSLEAATQLNLSSTVQSFPDLVTPTANDYYRFVLSAPSSLNLSLTGLDADANVELLDNGGNLVSVGGVPQRSANPGTFSEVINTILEPGVYFVRVSPGANTPQANYTLNISGQDNLLSTNLLWRSNSLAFSVIWTLDQTTLVNQLALSSDRPGNWSIAGTGDFNRDGNTDIIWRDELAALTDVWFMNGQTLLSSSTILPPLDFGWSIGGTSDFNGDGNTDIIWRNAFTGVNDVWFMNGATLLSSTSLFSAPGGWDIQAVGDFDRNGSPDLLWQNRDLNLNLFWLFDGLEVIALPQLPAVDPTWVLSGASDFNQDGNLDLVWRRLTPEGEVALWLMDRTAPTAYIPLPSVPPDWYVTAPYTTVGRPTPLDVAGNTFATAFDLGRNLAGAATYQQQVNGVSDPTDFYQFSIGSDARVNLALNDLSADLNLELYDSSRTLIQASNQPGNQPESIIRQLTAGTYLIRVGATNPTDSSAYALSLNINTPPLLVTNAILTLSEQGTANLSNAVLRVTDADNLPTEVFYTLGTLPANGALLLNGVTVTAGATFTEADVAAGDRLRYIHNGSETTSDRFTFTVSDNGGGSIGVSTFSFAVTPVNDPPLVVSNLGLTLSEGSAAAITTALLQFTDVDSAVTGLTYSLTTLPANGTLSLGGTAVSSFTQADLVGGALQYQHNGSETTSDRFTFAVLDSAGGITNSTFTIAVTPVNDPPALSLNLGLTVSEGDVGSITPTLLQLTDPDNLPESLTYSVTALPANGTLLLAGTAVTSFTQADVNSGSLQYRQNGSETTSDRFVFTVTDGLIPTPLGPNTFSINVIPVNDAPVIATNAGLTLSEGATAIIAQSRLQAIDPEGQTPVTYTLNSLPTNGVLRRGNQILSLGQTFTQAEIASDQIAYIHNDTETTTDSFQFLVSDAIGATTQVSTFSITILAVNDAPILTVPGGTRTIDQETNTLIPGIRVTDVDLGTGEVTVTVAAGNGVLSLRPSTGITFLTGDGTQDGTIAFRGSQDVTNFVLQSLLYRSNNNFQGTDTINITVSDGGNTGLGGPLSAVGSITLNVAPVNDAPILTVPGPQSVREDVASAIAGITVADLDAGSTGLQVSLTVTNGTLSLNSIAGIEVITGTGTRDKNLVFAGSLDAINTALASLNYLGDRDFNGTDTLQISVSDRLNGSNGIPLSDTETVAITVTPVNDAPILTVPGTQLVNENTDLRITGIRVTDVDATGDLTVNLFASSGRLSLNSTAGLTFETGDGSQDDILAFRGSQVALNDALRTLIYRANPDFNGTDTIALNVSDGGSTGVGGVLGDSDEIAVNVLGVNNAPVITLPTAPLAIDSDTNLVINGIRIADADVAGGILSVTLLAENGVLSLGSTAGLTFTQGGSNPSNRLTFSGTLFAVNAALDALTYRSYPGFTNAFDRISIQVTDNGNSGIGVPLADSDVLFVSVGGAVNQVPIAINDTFAVAEEGTLNGASVLTNDNDPDFTLPLSAQLGVGPANALAFTLNANGSFTYVPVANFSGSDTFTYRAIDALGGISNPATVVINVTGVNDAPIAGNDSFTTAEDQPITNGAVLTNDSDPDNTVPLSTQLITGPANAISFSLNPNGTFSYTPRNDFSGSDRFTYVVVDALGAVSNTATVAITVTPVNDAPLARNDGPFAVAAGGTLAITGAGVLSNDTDVDTPLANLTASLITGTPNGTVNLNPNGSFTYRPTGNFAGVDTFTYQASDGSLTSNLATVTISVGANTAPIANGDSFSLGEDGALTLGNVLTNDVDAEGNLPLTATVVTAPANALSFTLNPDGTFSYQPQANFNGVDTFVYRAIDSLGAISSNPATVTFNVTAVNDAPVAVNDTLSVSPGATLNVTAPGILANDTDIDSPALSAVLVSTTPNGTLSLNPNGSFTYRPNIGFVGTDSFTYRANDGSLSSANTATVALVVTTAANTLPIAAADVFSTPEDTPVTLGNVLTNDTDPDGNLPLTASVVAAPANALSFTLRPDGTFSYLPRLNFSGVDTFTYIATDSVGGNSAPATVTFSVTPVNDAPTAVNDSYTVATTASLNITAPGILANDTDVDSPSLTATLVATAANGTLSLNPNGSFTYQPNAGFSGVDRFTYRATDGSLTSANTATVNITVASVTNSAPIAVADTFNAIEDTPLTLGNVLTNDTDTDGNLPLTASVGVAPANALSFTLNSDGSFSYLPRLNFNGNDTFTYVAVDSLGARSQTATVTLSVAPVNDAPVAANNTFNVAPAGTLNITLPGVLANDTDPDGNPLTATLGTAPTGAASFTLNPDGSFLYIPRTTFSGTDSFTYQASDGIAGSNLATVTLSVTANTPPSATSDAFTVPGNTTLTVGNVLTNDTDPDGNLPLTASVVTAPANALSFTLNPNGSFSYLPRLNFSGNDTFTYVAIDSLGSTSTPTTVTFSVTPTNRLPIAGNDTVFINAGTSATITAPGVLANDTDPDGNPLTASLLTNAAQGTVTLNGNGSFVYTPNAGATGTDSFTYVANDGVGNSAPATVTIRVNAPPTAVNDTYTAAIGSTLNVAQLQGVLANDTDDSGALAASVVTGPTQGTLTLNPNGSFTYVPNAGATGTDSFVYRATDGLANATATVAIALRTNNAPVAVGESYRVPVNTTFTVGAVNSVLRNDTDPDTGTNLSASLVTNATRGTVTLNPDGTFTYSPQTGFQGTDSFVYRASDGITVSGPATVTLTVSNNTPPSVRNDTFSTFSGVSQQFFVPGVLAGDTDADGNSLTAFLVTPPVNGTVNLSPDGSFFYTANATFQGTDTFVYRAFDGVDSATATVSMSVRLNNPPSVQPDVYSIGAGQTLSVAATSGVLANDTDPDGTTLSAQSFALPSNGRLITLRSDGSFIYVPNGGFIGVDSFTYRASDGIVRVTSTVTVNVGP
ncbi:MAG: Ig-like domain-containing protein [Leptolyngbyaceae cyanobacterium bins.349]|nr:Ig-like domain-containing protein [Leptolyngbyaceae cyanobacterium bins.349]